MFIGLRSSCSVIGWTVGPRSSYSMIGWTVVIGPVSNWPVIGWTVVGRGWINMGGCGCGWIDIGGIKRWEVEGEAAAEVVTEAVVAAVWFIGCGRSIKGRRRDRPFFLSYI